MKFNKILYFTLFIAPSLFSQTEKTTTQQSMFWARYYNILSLDEKWSIHAEIENRIFIDPTKESSFDFQFSGRYKFNEHLEVGAGWIYFLYLVEIPDTDDHFHIGEQRLKQEIIYRINRNLFTVNKRLQLDERWLQNSDKLGLTSGNIFSLRLRYRLQLEYFIWKNYTKYLKAIVNDEIMYNLNRKSGDTYFEQNRCFIAVQTGFNKSLSFEVGYMNSYQLRPNGFQYLDKDIIRVTLLQRLKI